MSLIELEYSPEMETTCLTDNKKLVLALQDASPNIKFMTEYDDTEWPRMEQTILGSNPESPEKTLSTTRFDHDEEELGPDIFLPNKATPSVIRKGLFVIRNECKQTIF